MTCFWNGIIDSLTNSDKQILGLRRPVYRELIEICKLRNTKPDNIKWNSNVLEFYKRQDLDIRTTSNIQIRNKINSYDTKKYSQYYNLFENYKDKYNWLK